MNSFAIQNWFINYFKVVPETAGAATGEEL
jgi:hypothetical protein